MTEETYFHLLYLVAPFIERKDMGMQKAITPDERLTVTLKFLATGRSNSNLQYKTLMSPQVLSDVTSETDSFFSSFLYALLRLFIFFTITSRSVSGNTYFQKVFISLSLFFVSARVPFVFNLPKTFMASLNCYEFLHKRP